MSDKRESNKVCDADPNSRTDLKTLPFEASLEELQAVVKRLESGELSLEQALQQFELGVKLTRECQERLASAEQRVELLMKINSEGKAETQPFPSSK